jgi:riboflavin biosynthesis pyrimidine reductase
MRCLFPSGPDVDDVLALYAEGWLPVGGLRANVVTSVDGAVAIDGLSRGLQTPGDNQIFAALRDLADVVVVGARTTETERYRPALLSAVSVTRRAALGLSTLLPIAVLSRTLTIDPKADLFADPTTIVFTTTQANQANLEEIRAEVIVCGNEEVDLSAILTLLRSRGMTRILCEGGPTLLASFARAGLVDELCLTISPLLAGPGAGRMLAGAEWTGTRALKLVGLMEEEGATFHRYRVIHS